MPRTYTHEFFENKGGLNTKSSPMAMPLETSPDLLNVVLSKTGAIKKRSGWSNYSSAIGASGTIQGIFRLRTKTGANYMIAIEGGQIWEESATGTFDTSRRANLDSTVPFIGAAYNDKLFLANGVDPIQLYSGGENAIDIGSHPDASIPDAWGSAYPSGLELVLPDRAERMAAWGSSTDPSRVWFSSIQNALDWTTEGDAGGYNIYVLKDNGEPVTAVKSFKDFTVIFKETEMAIYAGDTAATMSLLQVFPTGCPAPRSIVRAGKNLYYWSQDGPTESRGVEEYGDIAPNHIGLKIEPTVRSLVNWSMIDQTIGFHDSENDRIGWLAPAAGDYRNKVLLWWRYDIGAWELCDNIYGHSALVYDEVADNTKIFLGSYDGYINELDGSYNDGGGAYTARYVTPWYKFGDYARRDRVLEITFACGKDGFNVDVYYQWDFEDGWTSIGNLTDFMADGASIWGSVNWGSFNWGAGQTGTVMVHPYGSGNVFRLKLENADADSTFEVLGWSIVQAPRGRR